MSSSDSRAQQGATTPPAEEWQAHWARTIPQLELLSRCTRALVSAAVLAGTLQDALRGPAALTPVCQPTEYDSDPCRQLGRAAQDITIMRSSQLDAARLDDELTGMLREQFLKVFSLFQPVSPAAVDCRPPALRWWVVFRPHSVGCLLAWKARVTELQPCKDGFPLWSVV